MLPLFLKSSAKVRLCSRTNKFFSPKHLFRVFFLMCVKPTLLSLEMQSFASFNSHYLNS